MQILTNCGGIAETNCYLIADETSGKAVLFDAPNDTTAALLEQAVQRGWDVTGLWPTHGHFDHVADHAVVTAKFPRARVLIHRLDEPKLLMPVDKMFNLPFEIPLRKADGYVEDGQELKIGNLTARVLHTPGHSPGHVMYYFAEQNVLVGGDLIIMGSVGRTDLPDSNYRDLQGSIRKVMALPPATQLLPGHGPPSRLADEAKNNPFVAEAMNAR
ncbi:MAG: MBL fold metallo-hydrolase [Tepidisphaeraceae bacterium]|jgi:glyoxylase-like metal-dependent hydrolase (beta-lactamase superfamily II)